jgi:hypothetical protein
MQAESHQPSTLDADVVLKTVNLLVKIFLGKIKLLVFEMEAIKQALALVSTENEVMVYNEIGDDENYPREMLKAVDLFNAWAGNGTGTQSADIWEISLTVNAAKKFPVFSVLVKKDTTDHAQHEQEQIVSTILTTLRNAIVTWSSLREVQKRRKLLNPKFDCLTFMSQIAKTTEAMYRSLVYIHKHFKELEDDHGKMCDEIEKFLSE